MMTGSMSFEQTTNTVAQGTHLKPEEAAISPLRILLIGASDAQEYWIRGAIRESGVPHEVTSFSSAIAALDGWHTVSKEIDVMFVNVKLPLLEIAEAVASLKRLPGLSSARVAVFVVDKSEIAAVPFGCHAVLMPGDPQDVVAVLRDSNAGLIEG